MDLGEEVVLFLESVEIELSANLKKLIVYQRATKAVIISVLPDKTCCPLRRKVNNFPAMNSS
ncbi:hypothetical protein GCM10027566_15760 [Arachidicoccus ginsenosidivorans]|jgi:hypothetical protein|uniref:Uncharacterized protein n=1 Tax=Arachidicoccus ginsenosidivorans TaxID=496057 RepID=A0A5B8VJZ4_9BACT|nr:hypothetical protein [Arachidicoccus ginsenosidivorans]QEC70946.1 hypothetical protein FSB73_03880 [Arachidicoccus ginsenosidivorans]